MSEPFTRPFADFIVDIECGLFALIQAGFGPIPCEVLETAELFEEFTAFGRIWRWRKWIYVRRCWRPLWCTAAKLWWVTVCGAQKRWGRIKVAVWCLMRLARRRYFYFYSWSRWTGGRSWPRWRCSRLRLCCHFFFFTFTLVTKIVRSIEFSFFSLATDLAHVKHWNREKSLLNEVMWSEFNERHSSQPIKKIIINCSKLF